MKATKKIIVSGIFVLLIIGLFEIFAIVTTRPRTTINYLAEYNKISKPSNYDPCQNAAQLYKEAFNGFVKMPKQLQKGDRTYAKWVDDFNDIEQGMLQKWLIANTDCIQRFKTASQKSYYWAESNCTDGNDLRSIKLPNIRFDLCDMSNVVAWDAKFNAAHGKYTEALDNVLAYYRCGFQRCTTSRFSIEFRDNLQKQQMAMETASLIMAKTQVPVSVLKSFQQELEEISDSYKYHIDFTADKLFFYDILQRTYIYKPDGTGRLSWKGIKEMSEFDLSSFGNWHIFKYFFAGPSQKEVKNQIDLYYEQVTAGFVITPWELNKTQPNYFEKLEHLRFDSPFFFVWGLSYGKDYYNYYNTQAQLHGLLTSIAILRFRQDKGHFPSKLDELVRAGYLRQLPLDPYSDKPLIYNNKGTDFEIYSVGTNFKDDGGEGYFYPAALCAGPISPPDLVFWPPTKQLKMELKDFLIHRKQIQTQETNQPK